MAKYDRTEWEKRKPDLTRKANPDVREQLFRENITFFQLGAWIGVSPSTVGLRLSKPLTAARRQKIDDATFMLEGWDYVSDSNLATIDVSAFHFEIPVGFQLSGLPVSDKLYIEAYGKVVHRSWLSAKCTLLTDCIVKSADNVSGNDSYYDWGQLGYNLGRCDGLWKITSQITILADEIQAEREGVRFDSAGGNAKFQTFMGRYRLPENLETFDLTFGYSGSNAQGYANGFTVKVYKEG